MVLAHYDVEYDIELWRLTFLRLLFSHSEIVWTKWTLLNKIVLCLVKTITSIEITLGYTAIPISLAGKIIMQLFSYILSVFLYLECETFSPIVMCLVCQL